MRADHGSIVTRRTWRSVSAQARLGRACRAVRACAVEPLEGRVMLSAADVPWARQFGSTFPDYGSAVAVDALGNVVVAGLTETTLPGQTSAGNNEAFVRKYDGSGTELWTRQFGTAASDGATGVAVDAAGNVYVAGWVGDEPIGPILDTNADAVVWKYDPAGNLLWTRQFGSAEYDDFGLGVAVDGSGDVYVLGVTDGALPGQTALGSRDAFLRRYDAAGTELWTRQFGTAGWDECFGVAVDGAGQVYVAGNVGGAVSYRAGDVFLGKYDGGGAEVWTRQFGTAGDDYARGVAADGAGNVYVTGSTKGSLSGQAVVGASDAFVRKYDAGGGELWTRQFGTAGYDSAADVATDSAGNAYVVSRLGRDMFVRAYDSSGTQQWDRGVASGSPDVGGVVVDPSGLVYVVGTASSALPGQAFLGMEDAFVVQVDPTVPEPVLVTGAQAGDGLLVQVRDAATGQVLHGFDANALGFSGGVRVAAGDLTGDGVADAIAATGPGACQVKVFDGFTGQQIAGPLGSFVAFPGPGNTPEDPASDYYRLSFTGGVYAACGDIDGDGRDDLILAADAGAGPHVKVFSGATGQVIRSFFAFAAGFQGGVRVAAGDVDADGRADIVVGAGPGAGPHVKVFSGATGQQIRSFWAFDLGFNSGLTVAAGDVDGDGAAEIVVGAGGSAAPHVKVFAGASNAGVRAVASFFALDQMFTARGVQVAVADANRDGRPDVLTALGGGSSQVQAFDITAPGSNPTVVSDFYASSDLDQDLTLAAWG